ncbi:hypothetical protein I6H48_07570 [Corynebacterium amycolatum]|uniref:Uncharacterized protein n=1 Tax=Corynebacterium amycolatum TaxID=43765 RepID=A0AB37G5L5_CORAY|nr:hypothetical protein [Corynebacterium amycolatum]QPR30001.1 hypothetical protein I6G95_07010 [Corynebacterium amycolatum]QQB81837.1 hypothetical protein I6H48_07570 [Corynebacterium amycolatum]
MSIDVESGDDGTTFDAGDLGTAWLPYSEPRACDLEALAIALIQHAQEMDAAALKEIEMDAAALKEIEMDAAALKAIVDEYHEPCLANGDDNTIAWIDRKRGEQ